MTKRPKHGRKRPMVRTRSGAHPFQRGIVTAAFVQRGASMEQALAASADVKRRLADRDEVEASEISALVEAMSQQLQVTRPAGPVPGAKAALRVRTSAGLMPFSRGLLLRRLLTSGLDVEPANAVLAAVTAELDHLTEPVVDEKVIELQVTRVLRAAQGEAFARRFELIGWARRSRRPVIVLIGGSTGTGKSTIAAELAARLGIRMVTGTDLIRATMRTVLSPHVVPGLHDHSFRGMGDAGQIVSNPRQRVLLGFHQQASQVGVGVRAVVRRAIEERTSLIIEGTHLVPPFESFLPPGSDALLVAFLLAVPNEERHRDRFPKRAREARKRSAAPYLEAFQSVRWIHDDLLQLAEDEDEVVITNESLDQTLSAVTSYLADALPLRDASTSWSADVDGREPQAITLFLVLDGLSDEPNPALGGRTPLAAADTPILNTLAATGALGELMTGRGDHAPGTDEGLVALLGTGEDQWLTSGRGALEALGAGVPLPPDGVLLRGNLATVQRDGRLADRRAGRIREGVADLLGGLRDVPLGGGIVGHIYPSHEHRVVVVLQGRDLSDQISATDPGGDAVIQAVLPCTPLDDSESAARTAHAVEALLARAASHLAAHPLNEARRAAGQHPANCILTRGASLVSSLPGPNPDAEAVAVVSGCATTLGVGRAFGYAVATSPRMTGNLDTDLDHKLATAGELLDTYRMVVVHIKGTDIAAHDRRPLEKKAFIEAIDQALGRFLQGREGLRVVVSADHGTSSRTGNHLVGPVPVLVSTWAGPGERAAFDEDAAASGVLGTLQPKDFAELLRAPAVDDGAADDQP